MGVIQVHFDYSTVQVIKARKMTSMECFFVRYYYFTENKKWNLMSFAENEKWNLMRIL